MKEETLLTLLANDEFGLLKIKHKSSSHTTEQEILISEFQEINNFYRINNHEPAENKQNREEFELYHRLRGIREQNNKVLILLEYDEFSLLGLPTRINSIQDIFKNDEFGLLHISSDVKEIFNLKHIPKKTNSPDYIAQRKPCKNFNDFVDLFQKCHKDLNSSKRELRPFKYDQYQNIDKNRFFILRGILVYVADVNIDENNADDDNPRLHCIFENGTEADLLKQSLITGLYQDGRIVTEYQDDLLNGFNLDQNCISKNDHEDGYIYVLQSLSKNRKIKEIKDLYKIGFSKSSPEKRIKNASQDSTYLYAPAKIIAKYKCYNLNPQKLEFLLHKFFASSCLDIDIFDRNRRRFNPREWFIVPLEIINRCVQLITNNKIDQYEYDHEIKKIIRRS